MPSAPVSALSSSPTQTASVASVLSPARRSGPFGIVVAPPTGRVPIVYLHGMWASPEDSCPAFERAASAYGPLVCPRGNLPAGAGGAWGGPLADKRRHLDEALVVATVNGPLAADGVLLGFSSGAAFALELALTEKRWSGLVLMSMSLSTTAAALRAAGVRRIVLSAGEQDGAFVSLRALATTLAAAGFPARFVSLGAVGHHFAVDMEARMVEVIAWVREGAS